MAEKRIKDLMLDLESLERISPDVALKEAVSKLGDKLRSMCPAFLVVVDEFDDNAEILGMLSVDDILFHLEPSAASMEELPIFWEGQFQEECSTILDRGVGEIMSSVTHVIHQSGTLMEAVHLLNTGEMDCLPVVDDGNVVGLLFKEDVFREVLAQAVSGHRA